MKLICIDIDGTLSAGIGGPLLPDAAEAVGRLQRHFEIRMVTNATSRTHAGLHRWLTGQGVEVPAGHLVTPALMARRVLTERGHDAGILLVDDAAREDFRWFRETPASAAAEAVAVLLASESHHRTVADLQPAFRAAHAGAALYTLQQNRYFRQGEDLVTDLGPVAAFLAYASDRPYENLGKPSRVMFENLAAEAGSTLAETVMIGDDAEFDASGAVKLGMQGVLVRTGKYRPGDETHVDPAPTAVLDSLADLPAWLED